MLVLGFRIHDREFGRNKIYPNSVTDTQVIYPNFVTTYL